VGSWWFGDEFASVFVGKDGGERGFFAALDVGLSGLGGWRWIGD